MAGLSRTWHHLHQDVRYAGRLLLRQRGFAVTVVLSLALGIGATATMFAFVDALLLRPLPVREPDGLVAIATSDKGLDAASTPFSHGFYQYLRGASPIFTRTIASGSAIGGNANLSLQGASDRVHAEVVSGNYFEELGVGPAIGRVLGRGDDSTPGGHPVLVLSHAFWQRRFGGAPDVVGREVSFNGRPFVIAGVADRRFFGTRPGWTPDVWVSTMMIEAVTGGSLEPNQPHGNYLELLVRLAPGVSRAHAAIVFEAVYDQWREARFGPSPSRAPARFAVVPASHGRSRLRGQYGDPLLMLTAGVGVLLVICCANVATLNVARALARGRELAVRVAIGAGRARLVRQLVTEAMVIAGLGGVLGWLVSIVLAQGLVHLLSTDAGAQFTPGLRSFVFTMGVAVVAGAAFGLAPAAMVVRGSIGGMLRHRDRAGRVWLRRFDLRSVLTSVQVALSLVLVVQAGLFVRTLQALRSVDAGFDREHVLLAAADPVKNGYEPARAAAFYDEAAARLAQQAGVVAAGWASHGSLSSVLPEGTRFLSDMLHAAGRTQRGDEAPLMNNLVTPGYLDAAGIVRLGGRDFGRQDRAGSPRVAIVNQAAARALFADEPPIGRRVGMGRSGPATIEIVGLVSDAKYATLRDPTPPIVYFPIAQRQDRVTMTLHVRATGDPRGLVPLVRREIGALDPALPLFRIETMRARVDDALRQERLLTRLAVLLSVLGTALAAVGLYGVVNVIAVQRTREVGIRMALGAQRHAIVLLVVRTAFVVAAIGVVAGLAAAAWTSRLFAALFFGVSGLDGWTAAVAVLVLLAVALVAAAVPARRASRVDPLVALRAD
jgi:predicted permease